MPVTQYYRYVSIGGNLTNHPSGPVNNDENFAHVMTGSLTTEGQSQAFGLPINQDDDGSNNAILTEIIPNAYITGVEIKIPMIIRGANAGSLTTTADRQVKIDVIRYTSNIIGISTPTNTDGGVEHIFTANASQLAATYDGSGATNDPRNYPLVIGGENFLGAFNLLNSLTGPTINPTSIIYTGLRVRYTDAASSTDEVAIGGQFHSTGDPGPALRYYYYYPKTTITTGKLKISSGKYHVKQNID